MFAKIKKFLLRINALQEQSDYPVKLTDEQHVCVHCGTSFTGNYCPQCGLNVRRSFFTLKAVAGKAADSLGFDESGNRSMLRTLRDLIWRPGYMIRDYLAGHSPAYFQPFKLLILLTIIFTLLAHMMGVMPEETRDVSDEFLNEMEEDSLRQALLPIMQQLKRVLRWFDRHIAYTLILQNIVVVTAMWNVYKKRVHYTWTETFIAQMYISCQFLMIAIVEMLLTWKFAGRGLFPYFVNEWIVLIVSLYDFFQLFGERHFFPALWRFIKVGMYIFILYLTITLTILFGCILYLVFTHPDTLTAPAS